MKKIKSLRKHYSGNLSREFWERVNRLDQPHRAEMYSCGVLLQNMEETVLRWLEYAEEI